MLHWSNGVEGVAWYMLKNRSLVSGGVAIVSRVIFLNLKKANGLDVTFLGVLGVKFEDWKRWKRYT